MASNTYAAKGNRQDISEIITNIAPYETPIYSRIGKSKAIATNHEWLEDGLGDAAANAQVEGFTFTTTDATPRSQLGNYTQIMERGVHVTGTQEAVQKHGIKSEIAYQLAKKFKELALDCERAIIVQDAKVVGNTSTARQMGGLPYWIVTNKLTNGSARALTFDLVNEALEKTWNAGGKPSILLVSPRNKRVVSTFTAGHVKHMDGNKTKKLMQTIDVLETDFGLVQTLVDRLMPNTDVYGLSPEYMKRAVLRPFVTVDLPKTADSHQKNIHGEWTLEMRAEKAHFVIKNLDGKVPGA